VRRLGVLGVLQVVLSRDGGLEDRWSSMRQMLVVHVAMCELAGHFLCRTHVR